MARIALATVALMLMAGGCRAQSDGGGHALSALNDTDSGVVVQVRTNETRTIAIPPHTYVGLAGGWASVDPSWAVTIWDSKCGFVRTEPISTGAGLLYIGPGGRVEWRADTSSASPYVSDLDPAATACPPA